MIKSISGALAHKRSELGQKEKGFTLIELLVVVIIIGILAAIAIPVYLGIQNNAKDSAAQSDLTNWKTGVVAAQTSSATQALPTTQVLSGVPDSGTSVGLYKYGSSTTFCISTISGSGKVFKITESTSATALATTVTTLAGGCP